MKRFFNALIIICTINIASPTFADDYYRRPGVGGFGIDTRKIKCPNCGKEISATDSHMCRKVGSSSSTSSSSSSSSSNMSAAEAEAISAAHPEWLVNQCSFPDPSTYTNSQQTNSENESSEEENYYRNDASRALHTFKSTKSHTVRNTISVLGIILILFLIFRHRRKARKRKALESYSNETESKGIDLINCNPEPSDLDGTSTNNPESTAKSKLKDMSEKAGKFMDSVKQSDNYRKTQASLQKGFGQALDMASDIIDNVKKSSAVQDVQSKMQKSINSAKEKVISKLNEYSSTHTEKKDNLSIADEITKLNDLKSSGAITDEEFLMLKNRILGK